MISLGNLSIPKKIVTIIMITAAAALLLASGALITYDFITARNSLLASTAVFAQIVAYNTAAAVSFTDRAAALDILSSLRAERSVAASCIYTPQGLFAEYVETGYSPCPKHETAFLDDSDGIWVSAPIDYDNKRLGNVRLRATLAPLYAHMRVEVVTIAGILVIASLFAFALSSRLHRLVSEPILNLARTANSVSRHKDYSIRAIKQSEDELGTLVDSLNEMLSQIQAREAVLEQRTRELMKANTMKDEFLATLSHELRTPLNSILGWSVLIQGGRLPAEKVQSALEAIERNARAQARLIEDLLDVSRIISGKFTLDSSEIMLKPIMDSAVDVIRPAAEAKQIRIDLEYRESVRVLGDGSRLHQALLNLLSNAVKFTAEGGTIRVVLEKAPKTARISVMDNGIGIAPEFLPFVFDRFRQADGSSTRAHGGLGLGLAIVRHIIETHGGSVSVESQGKGYGTKFTIEVPLGAPTGELSRREQVR
jgi:signal transduction histidine kinase